MLTTPLVHSMQRSQTQSKIGKFMMDVTSTIPEIYEQMGLLFREVRERGNKEIMEVLKGSSEKYSLAISVGEVPTDAILMKALTKTIDVNAAKIVFDMLYHLDPVNVTNILWISDAMKKMTGKDSKNKTPRQVYEGDPDFLMHQEMKNYVSMFMQKFENHEPVDLARIPDSFGKRMDYMLDLDHNGDVHLQMGLVLSFLWNQKQCVSTVCWRISFDMEIINFVVGYALNDSTLHHWTTAPQQ